MTDCRTALGIPPQAMARIFTRADLAGPFKHISVSPEEIIAVFKSGTLVRIYTGTAIGSRGSLIERMQGWLGRSTGYELMYVDISEKTLPFSVGKEERVCDAEGIPASGRVAVSFEVYPFTVAGLYPLVRGRIGRVLTYRDIRKIIREDMFVNAILPYISTARGMEIGSVRSAIEMEFEIRRSIGRKLLSYSLEITGVRSELVSVVVDGERIFELEAEDVWDEPGSALMEEQKVERILSDAKFEADIEELEARIDAEEERDRKKKKAQSNLFSLRRW